MEVYGEQDVHRLVALNCASKEHKIARLKKGLEDIIRHQEIAGGAMASLSTVVCIAQKALDDAERM